MMVMVSGARGNYRANQHFARAQKKCKKVPKSILAPSITIVIITIVTIVIIILIVIIIMIKIAISV